MTGSVNNNPVQPKNTLAQGGMPNYYSNSGINYSKVLNPPAMPDCASIKSKEDKDKDKDKTPKTFKDKAKDFLKKVVDNPEKSILAGMAIAIGAVLLRGQASKLLKNFKVIRNVGDLGKYVDELSKASEKKIKGIKINFPLENYQEKDNFKRFINLSSDEIEDLKAHPDRISDIVKAINGTLEAIKRQPQGANQRIKIILGEKARGQEQILADIIKSGGINQHHIYKYDSLLSEVLGVETHEVNPKKLGFFESRVSNPVYIDVNTHNYLQSSNYADTIFRWIERFKGFFHKKP